MNDNIHWEQAYQNFQHNKKEDLVEAKRMIEEIESSDFGFLDYRDIAFYASTLNELSNRVDKNGKVNPYTNNEITRMNMEAKGIASYDLLHTFVDDDTDDVIDFY